jgi:type VI secretion system protein ImpH
MATAVRQLDPDVASEPLRLLYDEPCSVSFFQAVRLLRMAVRERSSIGGFVPPAKEPVRFESNPSLAFPASEIQALEMPSVSNQPARMKVNFMGLCSPVGTLPTPYTELIIERAKKKDNGFRDFLEIFNHRVISLFYRAWEKYRFYVSYERGEPDPITPILRSFVGLGTKGLEDRQEVADESLLFYAGMLGQRPRSATALQQILNDFFGVPVEVEQFVGKWISLDRRDQTEFRDAERITERLGCGAVVGDEVWDTQSTVRVKLGPLSREQYLDFLPRPESRAHSVLNSILKFYCGEEIDFEVQLILRREETQGVEIAADEDPSLMLGWTTWIKNAPLGRDPDDAVLSFK